MTVTEQDIESMEGFQQQDKSDSWQDEPSFQWTEDDLDELEWEERTRNYEQESMAGWWEMEGVRCATFGRNPAQNPYLVIEDRTEARAVLARIGYSIRK